MPVAPYVYGAAVPAVYGVTALVQSKKTSPLNASAEVPPTSFQCTADGVAWHLPQP